MKNPNEHHPIQPQVAAQMNAFGAILDELLNGNKKGLDREWGWALMVFPFGAGDDHRSNYISNANRDDMISTMKEFIARAEGRMTHEYHERKPT